MSVFKALVWVTIMAGGIWVMGVGVDELIAADLTTAGQIAMGFVITVILLALALIISSL